MVRTLEEEEEEERVTNSRIERVVSCKVSPKTCRGSYRGRSCPHWRWETVENDGCSD